MARPAPSTFRPRTARAASRASRPPPGERARTCVGCRAVVPPEELVRLVVTDDGAPVVDLAGKAFGRGSWVHPAAECVDRAAQQGLARSQRRSVRIAPAAFHAALAAAADRRLSGLVLAARRAGYLAVGTVAVEQALLAGAPLVIVACDARAAADTGPVLRAVSEGRAAAWNDKQGLGRLLGRDDVAVVAITDPGLARAAQRAAALKQLPLARGPNEAGVVVGPREDG